MANVGNAHAQDQSIDSGCGANVGSVANSTVSVSINCGQNNKVALSGQYSRLFGGAEVPLLMGLFGQPKLTSASPWPRSFRAFATAPGEEELVNVKVIRFLERIPYKDARPLLTKLWTDVAANQDAAAAIQWRASGGLRNERICYFATQQADQSGYYVEHLIGQKLMRNAKSCDKTIGQFDGRVGFTFIVIQNDSDQPLTDVYFQFRQNYEANRIDGRSRFPDLPDYLKSNELEKIPDSGSAISNLVTTYGTAADVEFKVGRLQSEYVFAARIEPMEKLLALLDVYAANENRLPATYLSGIYIFDEVRYSIDGTPGVLKVRPPSLGRAARVMVPYGWASQ